MKRLIALFILVTASLSLSAQMSKSEVEGMIKGVNFQEIKEVYLIRTREHDGSNQGWFEKYEQLDPKTTKMTFNEKSLLIEGTMYSALIPYDKIKLIFLKKSSYLSIELID